MAECWILRKAKIGVPLQNGVVFAVTTDHRMISEWKLRTDDIWYYTAQETCLLKEEEL